MRFDLCLMLIFFGMVLFLGADSKWILPIHISLHWALSAIMASAITFIALQGALTWFEWTSWVVGPLDCLSGSSLHGESERRFFFIPHL